MFRPPIQDILTQALQQLPAIITAPSLRHDVDELLHLHAPAGALTVVDDAHSCEAYGGRVYDAIHTHAGSRHITLPAGVKPDEEALARIIRESEGTHALIAVGSGTINDLVKYAAFQTARPYFLVPTATSMNGYLSITASLWKDGKKQSLTAALPRTVYADMGLLRAAPLRLIQAGIGDSMARPTAQTDWLLAHHLTGEPYDPRPYQLTTESETCLFNDVEAVIRRDPEAIANLFELLLLSGLGMTIAGSSRPASGAEHMLAHMLSNHEHLHGEEIAVTSVTMAQYQERLLADRRWKAASSKKLDLTTTNIDAACQAMAEIALPATQLAQLRRRASLAEHPEALGWSKEQYRHALLHAADTRDRVTCLDVGLEAKDF